MRAHPIAFRSDGLALAGELVVPDAPRAVVILCHGIPSGRPPDPEDAGYAGLARELAAHDLAAMSFDFRGCRGAPGDLSMAGWCRDLDAAIDALAARDELSGVPRAVLGSSAGGAVAITVAARRSDVRAVATLAAVASFWLDDLIEPESFLHESRNKGLIRDPAFPADPAGWAAELDDVSGERHAGAIAPRPLLLVHGDADETVPLAHALRVFEAAGEPKELVTIPRGAHQLRRDPRAVQAVLDWFDRFLPLRGDPGAGQSSRPSHAE